MSSNEERIAILEANSRNIFHQLDEHKQAIDNIQRLTIAVEKLVEKTNIIGDKVEQIDDRLNQVEQQPIRKYEKVRELVIAALLSAIGGIVIGVFTTLVLK